MTPTTDNFSRQRLLENLQKVAQYVVRKAQNPNALRSIVSIWKNENGVFEMLEGKVMIKTFQILCIKFFVLMILLILFTV